MMQTPLWGRRQDKPSAPRGVLLTGARDKRFLGTMNQFLKERYLVIDWTGLFVYNDGAVWVLRVRKIDREGRL